MSLIYEINDADAKELADVLLHLALSERTLDKRAGHLAKAEAKARRSALHIAEHFFRTRGTGVRFTEQEKEEERACTCPEDERPPMCRHKFALSECWATQARLAEVEKS